MNHNTQAPPVVATLLTLTFEWWRLVHIWVDTFWFEYSVLSYDPLQTERHQHHHLVINDMAFPQMRSVTYLLVYFTLLLKWKKYRMYKYANHFHFKSSTASHNVSFFGVCTGNTSHLHSGWVVPKIHHSLWVETVNNRLVLHTHFSAQWRSNVPVKY